MTKFIVRESSGEFYKSIVADDIEAAKAQLGTPNAIAFWGYTIEPAPVAEMFTNPDWENDFNDKRSLHHY